MKFVIAITFLCALAYSVECVKVYQWGTITNVVACRENVVVKGKILRVVTRDVSCATVSIP